MPAKAKQLPQPCPICGRKNGSFRIVQDKYVQIRHYIREAFEQSKIRKSEVPVEDNVLQDSMVLEENNYAPSGMVAHSFQSDWASDGALNFNRIKILGWKRRPNESSRYKRRQPKHYNFLDSGTK
jgi:hypothetical protein